MSSRLALVRAAHLHDYIAVMREFGAPVDRDLAHSALPTSIEETPDLYVSIPIAMEWVAKCGHDVEPMELGLLASSHASLASLRPSHQAAIIGAQTGFRRLEALFTIAQLEDNCFRAGVRQEADQLRVLCDTARLSRHPFICFAEWLNLQAVIAVIRSVAGPAWYPQEMTFVSRYAVPAAVQTAFPNTRILVGQPNTSVLIDREHLARSTGGAAAPADDLSGLLRSGDVLGASPEPWTFAGLLRQIIQPYLREGNTDLAFTAEVVGMSKRTLQRQLQASGSSYSEILQEARFERARSLLDNPGAKVIEVAMASGYESPQHFTRAFRRFTGVTPTTYRRLMAGAQSSAT